MDNDTWVYYIYDGMNLVADYDAINGRITRTYSYGPGVDNIQSMTIYDEYGGSETYYYIKDASNTVYGLVDVNNEIVEYYHYDAFGNFKIKDNYYLWIPESAYGNRFLFQGREYDYATQLYYFRNRWYEPETGRWLSPDPIGISGGLNLYAFCGNDPVNFVDPWGLAHFGTRPLDCPGGRFFNFLYKVMPKPIRDFCNFLNIIPCHEHLFFDDGTNENMGFFKPREGYDEKYRLGPDKNPLDGYDMGPNIYDDARMKRARDMVNARIRSNDVKYSLIGISYWDEIPPGAISPGYYPVPMPYTELEPKYNCQDWCTDLRWMYFYLLVEDTLKEIF